MILGFESTSYVPAVFFCMWDGPQTIPWVLGDCFMMELFSLISPTKKIAYEDYRWVLHIYLVFFEELNTLHPDPDLFF